MSSLPRSFAAWLAPALVALALLGSCGDGGEPRQQPDAGADAPPDGPSDAPPDAPVLVDGDSDGTPASADCDDADAARWQLLAYTHRDHDGDQRTVPSGGAVCAGAQLPAGYFAEAHGADCDDADATRFELLTGYVDADGDHFGVGEALALCTGGALPAGHAAVDGDCAPGDAAAWLPREYAFRDADGDGAAVAASGAVCSGAALPAGYLLLPPAGRPLDCDDADAQRFAAISVFVDGDGDGFGAGPSQLACTDGAAPPGTSPLGSDCDDAAAALWMALGYVAIDEDGDGATVPAGGTRCTAGFLTPPYYAAPIGSDCDDANPALTRRLVLYADHDGDGVGISPRQLRCLGQAVPDGLSPRGYDEDDADPAVVETEDFDELLDLVLL